MTESQKVAIAMQGISPQEIWIPLSTSGSQAHSHRSQSFLTDSWFSNIVHYWLSIKYSYVTTNSIVVGTDCHNYFKVAFSKRPPSSQTIPSNDVNIWVSISQLDKCRNIHLSTTSITHNCNQYWSFARTCIHSYIEAKMLAEILASS